MSDVQQSPPKLRDAFDHDYSAHYVSPEGYGVCRACGARENTKRSALDCPGPAYIVVAHERQVAKDYAVRLLKLRAELEAEKSNRKSHALRFARRLVDSYAMGDDLILQEYDRWLDAIDREVDNE